MRLATYIELIKNLPYLDQSFETAKETWDKYSLHPSFKDFHTHTFKEDTVSYSRRDLFTLSEGNIHTAILSILQWGYPRNMRGNNFSSILDHLSKSDIQITYYQDLSDQAFTQLSRSLKQSGIGLSTLSKFLYFFSNKIDGYKCLILDRRILDVLQKGSYEELKSLQTISEFNKIKIYPKYLQLLSELSQRYGFLEDQLELFLFLFGNHLKQKAK